MTLETAAARLEDRMRALGRPERAEGEKRYLKSDLEFLGVPLAGIRQVVKQLAHEHPRMVHADLVALAEKLWAEPIFERRMAAVILLQIHPRLLSERDLVLVERLIRESKTWALVDALAVNVVGPIAMQHPAAYSALDRWAGDHDFWVRRSALLAMLKPLRGDGDFSRFARYASAMVTEKEFFVRKAIGWVLRETAKRRPDEVYEWLAPRTHVVSGVTIREAVKYLAPKRRTRLLDAYKSLVRQSERLGTSAEQREPQTSEDPAVPAQTSGRRQQQNRRQHERDVAQRQRGPRS